MDSAAGAASIIKLHKLNSLTLLIESTAEQYHQGRLHNMIPPTHTVYGESAFKVLCGLTLVFSRVLYKHGRL